VETLQSGVCVCDTTGGMGVFMGSKCRFSCVGSGSHVEMEGWAAATSVGRPPFSHVPPQRFWNIPPRSFLYAVTKFEEIPWKSGVSRPSGGVIDPPLGPTRL
jgi:hypothetical protein